MVVHFEFYYWFFFFFPFGKKKQQTNKIQVIRFLHFCEIHCIVQTHIYQWRVLLFILIRLLLSLRYDFIDGCLTLQWISLHKNWQDPFRNEWFHEKSIILLRTWERQRVKKERQWIFRFILLSLCNKINRQLTWGSPNSPIFTSLSNKMSNIIENWSVVIREMISNGS